jgi:hypothetical protein
MSHDYGYQHHTHVIDWLLYNALKFYKDAILYGHAYALNGLRIPPQDVFDIETEQREGWTYQ